MTIISNRCVHLGCPAQSGGPRQDENRETVTTEQAELTLTPIQPANFSCPCHGGAYDSVGRVTAGPPARPLDRFDFKVVDSSGKTVEVADAPDDARVLIGKPYSVDVDFNQYDLRGPGEPVKGVLSNLYPF
jgi:Rieske Fe-S protein